MSLESGLAIGSEIDGHRLEAVLEQDVLGILYLATDLRVQRPVMLRIINPILAQDPIFVQQFQVEASRLAQLNHPNILAVYDIRDTNQATYLSMEYVEGEPLSTYLDQVRGPRWRLGVPLLLQVLEALDYAHEAGILHESLKPERILITPDGRVKLADFGLNRMLKKVSLLPLSYNDADIRGYPAPELLDAHARVDARADVYSVGLILYEILTGVLPFDRQAPDFVVRTTLNDALIQNPARLNPDVPRRLAQITMKALRKHPNDRYASARALLDDLAHADERPQRSARAPRPNPFRGLMRRLMSPVTAAYAAALVMLVSGSLYAFQSPSGDPYRALSLDGPPPAMARPTPRPNPRSNPPQAVLPPAPASRMDPAETTPSPARTNPSPAVAAPRAASPATPRPTRPADPPAPFAVATTPATPSTPAASTQGAPPPATQTPAPRRKPAVGWLAITSHPSGALVLINGKMSGKTPSRGTALPPGPTNIALALAGYDAVLSEIDIEAGRTSALDHTLNPSKGAIKLTVSPRGDIYLDDALVVPGAQGLHVLMASPDTHLVSVRHPAFGRWERLVAPRHDREIAFEVDFTETQTLDVLSLDPNGAAVIAEILIDGAATGHYTPMTVEAPVGLRTIEVRADGYRMVGPVQVNIEPGRREPLEIRLEPMSISSSH